VSERPSLPLVLLRIEGATLLALAVYLYARLDQGWVPFAVLILAPDVSILGYAGGNRLGAIVYNAFHTYLPPALLAAVAVATASSFWVGVALVWFAHIGMDRALGYGLKHLDGFRHTHLGWIGGSRSGRG
jgi:Domain of unknown function (DUF4260)